MKQVSYSNANQPFVVPQAKLEMSPYWAIAFINAEVGLLHVAIYQGSMTGKTYMDHVRVAA